MTLLSFCAIMLLPRQFHVSVVENSSPAEVSRARWLFPLYLVAINLFVIPIAIAGLVTFPFGAVDSDMYVLALPIEGEFAAAQHCRLRRRPVGGDRDGDRGMRRALHHGLQRHRPAAGAAAQPGEARDGSKDFGDFLLRIRRFAIFAIMVMAYFYYRALGNTQLAAIGLLSFAALAQLAPAFFGGLFWRAGNRARRHDRHAGRLRGVGLYAVPAELPGGQHRRPAAAAARTVRHRGAAAAGAVRRRSAAADAWRAVVALAQHPDLHRDVARARAVVDRTAAGGSVRAQHADADRADLPALADDRYRAGHPEHGGAISRPRARPPGLRGLCRRAIPAISIRPRPPISNCCSTPNA